MDIKIRIQQIVNELHSCNKELYRRDEILPELLGLQDEIVRLTFNEIHGEQAQLRIWDVENHLEELNRENGIDSLGIVSLVVLLEEKLEFDADKYLADIRNCKRVVDLVELVKKIKKGDG